MNESERAQVSFSTYISFSTLSYAFVAAVLLYALLCCIQSAITLHTEGMYS